MATDYDTPRKTDDDTDSIEALKKRGPHMTTAPFDIDDADNPIDFELDRTNLPDIDLDIVVLPPQADEFTCGSGFLVQHRSRIDHEGNQGPICFDCAN